MNLSPLDRLDISRTSARFAYAVSQIRMLHDVRFVISIWRRMDEAIDVLMGSQRRYRSLKLDQGERLVVLRFFEARFTR